MEVMIALAVIASAMGTVLLNLATLSGAQAANREAAIVLQISNSMSERILGAQWSLLGRYDVNDPAGVPACLPNYSWSWHRRLASTAADPPAPFDGDGKPGLPPLSDANGTPAVNSLIATGILTQPSGLANLKVYLEYYQDGDFDTIFTAADQRAEWQQISNKSALLPEDPQTFNLAGVTRGILARIIVTWDSAQGGSRTQITTVSRRQ